MESIDILFVALIDRGPVATLSRSRHTRSVNRDGYDASVDIIKSPARSSGLTLINRYGV